MSTSIKPLEAYLRRLIARHGPITVAEYMALALGHPDYGYYQTRDPLGRDGDFITAPEISQMFGEMIAAWAIATWQGMGQPNFNLVEFGPGRGTLMRDFLRVAGKIAPRFVSALSLHLVETSPVLRDAQAQALNDYAPIFHAGIEDVPEGPAIFLMNEFLDALPLRQFVMTDRGLCERRVGLAEDSFAFVVEREAKIPAVLFNPDPVILSAAKNPLSTATPEENRDESLGGETILRCAQNDSIFKIGSIVETCPAALAITRNIAQRIAQHGGAALIVDYGYDAPQGHDTFQAVRAHDYANPLQNPGEVDLTAHVDFAAIAQAARQEGAIVTGPIGQGAFLTALGIAYRARMLADAGDATAEAALHRLTADDQMGQLFKVLVLGDKK